MSKTLHDLNGWIDREGRIHSCPSNGHKQKAIELKTVALPSPNEAQRNTARITSAFNFHRLAN